MRFPGPKSFKDISADAVAPYRTLKLAMEDMRAHDEQTMFFALEMKSKRNFWSAYWFSTALSYIYQAFTNFGDTPGLPLIWLAGMWVVGTGIIYHEGALLALACDEYLGWQKIYLGEGFWPQIFRSAGMSLESLRNPFGIFQETELLIEGTLFAKNWLGFQSLLSTVAFTLFILAIRRKFRL